jgi:D-alanine-D-alanine ligase
MTRSRPQSRPRVGVAFNLDQPDAAKGSEDTQRGFEASRAVTDVARAVIDALRARGWHVESCGVVADPGEAIGPFVERGVGVVFNLVESLGGDSAREPEFARAVRAAGLRLTGSPPSALQRALDKGRARGTLGRAGVPVPRGAVVRSPRGVRAALRNVGLPAFVKPARTDASIGIDQESLVRTEAQLWDRVRERTAALGPLVVEEWLPGREFNVAMLPGGRAVVTEIDYTGCPPGRERLLSYAAKWQPDSDEFYMRSRPLDVVAEPALGAELVVVGLRALAAIGVRGYGRADIRMNVDGKPRVIDVNPNPDLDPTAGLSVAATAAGLAWDELIEAIVLEALRG